MTTPRTTVYLSARAQEILGTADNRSGRLSDCLDRYGLIIERAQRELSQLLTEPELAAITSAAWSLATSTIPAELLRYAALAEIESVLPSDPEHLQGVDYPALAAKLRGLTVAQDVALIEMIEQRRNGT